MSSMVSICLVAAALFAAADTPSSDVVDPGTLESSEVLPPLVTEAEGFDAVPRLRRGSASPVVAGFLSSSDAAVRLRGVEGIDDLESAFTIETLLKALYDESPRVRITAARRLGEASPIALIVRVWESEIQRPEAFWESFWRHIPEWGADMGPPLTAYLERDDITGDQGAIAAHALGLLRYVPAGPVLARRAWVQHPELAYRSSVALLRLGESGPGEEQHKLVRHPLPEVRMQAVHTLATQGDQTAIDTLHAVVLGQSERNMEVRKQAILALRNMEYRSVLPALIDLIGRVPALNLELRHALIEVAGLDNGPNANIWREWYEALVLYESGNVEEANRRLEALQTYRSVRLR